MCLSLQVTKPLNISAVFGYLRLIRCHPFSLFTHQGRNEITAIYRLWLLRPERSISCLWKHVPERSLYSYWPLPRQHKRQQNADCSYPMRSSMSVLMVNIIHLSLLHPRSLYDARRFGKVTGRLLSSLFYHSHFHQNARSHLTHNWICVRYKTENGNLKIGNRKKRSLNFVKYGVLRIVATCNQVENLEKSAFPDISVFNKFITYTCAWKMYNWPKEKRNEAHCMLTKKRKINKSSFQNNGCNLITDTRAHVYSADFHVCMAIRYIRWIYLHTVQIIIVILFQPMIRATVPRHHGENQNTMFSKT